jgi:Spy/CpxP family protein refolding chaperone
MKSLNMAVLAVMLAGAVPAAFAGQPQPPQPGNRYDDRMDGDERREQAVSPEKREETRKKIEAVRIWRLTEELKLDSDKSAKLSSLLSSLDQKRRDIQRDQAETMRTLRQTLKALKPDEAKIRPLLDKLEHDHHAMQELRNRELKDLKDLLTTEQQARFLLFQQRFQREMREMISSVRGAGPGKTGAGPGMGSGPMRGGPAEQPDK